MKGKWVIKQTGSEMFFDGIERGKVWTTPNKNTAKHFSTRREATDIMNRMVNNGCQLMFEVTK